MKHFFFLILYIVLTSLSWDANGAESLDPGDLRKLCDANNALSCKQLGENLFSQEKWAEAEEVLDKACDLKNMPSCCLLAQSIGKQGRTVMMKVTLESACDKGFQKACEDLKTFKNLEEGKQAANAAKEKQEIESKKSPEQLAQEAVEEKQRIAEEKKQKAQQLQLAKLASQCKKQQYKDCISLGLFELQNGSDEQAGRDFETACELNKAQGCHVAGVFFIAHGSLKYGRRLLNEACLKKNLKACKEMDTFDEKQEQEKREYEAKILEEQQQLNARQYEKPEPAPSTVGYENVQEESTGRKVIKAFGLILQGMGQGLQNANRNNVNCFTTGTNINGQYSGTTMCH